MIDDYQYHQQFQNTLEPEPEAYVSLADAILLGAAITEPKPYDLDHCALGMAANAMGMAKARRVELWSDMWRSADGGATFMASPRIPYRSDAIAARWPWLHNICRHVDSTSQQTTNWNWIADMFNECVCPRYAKSTMTLEELCTKIRRIEAEYIPELAARAKSPIDTAPITYETAIATSGVNCS